MQCLVSVIKVIAERGLALRGDNENFGSPRKFFQICSKFFQATFQKKRRWKASGDRFAALPQIANHCQISCCIKIFYNWVNACNVTRLLHKYKWSVEILLISSIIPYLKILYPNMGPPTTPGPQDPTIWVRRCCIINKQCNNARSVDYFSRHQICYNAIGGTVSENNSAVTLRYDIFGKTLQYSIEFGLSCSLLK